MFVTSFFKLNELFARSKRSASGKVGENCKNDKRKNHQGNLVIGLTFTHTQLQKISVKQNWSKSKIEGHFTTQKDDKANCNFTFLKLTFKCEMSCTFVDQLTHFATIWRIFSFDSSKPQFSVMTHKVFRCPFQQFQVLQSGLFFTATRSHLSFDMEMLLRFHYDFFFVDTKSLGSIDQNWHK